MENTKEKPKSIVVLTVLKIVIIIILIPIIFFNSVIIIDSLLHKDEIPSFFGWKPFIVMSGSMVAELYPGDVAITKEVDANTLKVGDIIAFRESKDFVVTHRIAEITNDDDGNIVYVTKGDANNDKDINTVSQKQVEGIFIKRIPKLGNFLLKIQTPIGTVISISIPIAILLILHAVENKKASKYIRKEENENEGLKQEIERLKMENEKLANDNPKDEQK